MTLTALRRHLMTPCGEPCNVMEQGGAHVLSALNAYKLYSVLSIVHECGSPGTGSRTRQYGTIQLYPDQKAYLRGEPPNPACTYGVRYGGLAVSELRHVISYCAVGKRVSKSSLLTLTVGLCEACASFKGVY